MRKILLLLTLATFMLSSVNSQGKFVNRINVQHQKKSVSGLMTKGTPNVMLSGQKAKINVSTLRKVTAASEPLMSNDFETSLDDWMIYDLDGFITSYWDTAESWIWSYENSDNKNSVLESSSWFATAGVADDWVFSAAFTIPNDGGSYAASWDAIAANPKYKDGYEFRIIEDANYSADTTSFTANTTLSDVSTLFKSTSTVLFTTTGENASWTNHIVTLDAYKGKKVRLIWRNNSNDMDILMLDNVIAYKKENYATTSKIAVIPVVPYAIVPEFLAKNYSSTISAKLTNNGSLPLTGVTANFSAYKNDTLDFSDLVSVGALAVSASNTAVSKAYNITAAKTANNYYFSTQVDATESAMSYTESATIVGPELSDSVYARDNGSLSNYTSISSSDTTSTTKKMGNHFELTNKASLNSVDFAVFYCSAKSTVVRILSTTDFVTFAEVAKSEAIALIPNDTVVDLYTVKFSNLTLPAGNYLVTVDEPAGKSIGIVYTDNSPGTSGYYTINGTTWKPVIIPLYIRLNVSQPVTGIIDQYSKNLNVYYANGSIVVNGLKTKMNASVITLTGQELYSTKLTNENNNINIRLTKGVYLVKIEGSAYKVIVD